MSDLEANPTLDLINALQGDNFNNAAELFKDILGDKMEQSLDAEKVAVADQIFNGIEPVDTDMNDDEVDAVLDMEFEED
tara:strand:+ start:133 stop:369 length:237 start_codon:yes stop_codon:yes gene_type:complete